MSRLIYLIQILIILLSLSLSTVTVTVTFALQTEVQQLELPSNTGVNSEHHFPDLVGFKELETPECPAGLYRLEDIEIYDKEDKSKEDKLKVSMLKNLLNINNSNSTTVTTSESTSSSPLQWSLSSLQISHEQNQVLCDDALRQMLALKIHFGQQMILNATDIALYLECWAESQRLEQLNEASRVMQGFEKELKIERLLSRSSHDSENLNQMLSRSKDSQESSSQDLRILSDKMKDMNVQEEEETGTANLEPLNDKDYQTVGFVHQSESNSIDTLDREFDGKNDEFMTQNLVLLDEKTQSTEVIINPLDEDSHSPLVKSMDDDYFKLSEQNQQQETSKQEQDLNNQQTPSPNPSPTNNTPPITILLDIQEPLLSGQYLRKNILAPTGSAGALRSKEESHESHNRLYTGTNSMSNTNNLKQPESEPPNEGSPNQDMGSFEDNGLSTSNSMDSMNVNNNDLNGVTVIAESSTADSNTVVHSNSDTSGSSTTMNNPLPKPNTILATKPTVTSTTQTESDRESQINMLKQSMMTSSEPKIFWDESDLSEPRVFHVLKTGWEQKIGNTGNGNGSIDSSSDSISNSMSQSSTTAQNLNLSPSDASLTVGLPSVFERVNQNTPNPIQYDFNKLSLNELLQITGTKISKSDSTNSNSNTKPEILAFECHPEITSTTPIDIFLSLNSEKIKLRFEKVSMTEELALLKPFMWADRSANRNSQGNFITDIFGDHQQHSQYSNSILSQSRASPNHLLVSNSIPHSHSASTYTFAGGAFTPQRGRAESMSQADGASVSGYINQNQNQGFLSGGPGQSGNININNIGNNQQSQDLSNMSNQDNNTTDRKKSIFRQWFNIPADVSKRTALFKGNEAALQELQNLKKQQQQENLNSEGHLINLELTGKRIRASEDESVKSFTMESEVLPSDNVEQTGGSNTNIAEVDSDIDSDDSDASGIRRRGFRFKMDLNFT